MNQSMPDAGRAPKTWSSSSVGESWSGILRLRFGRQRDAAGSVDGELLLERFSQRVVAASIEKDGELIKWRCELSSANRLARFGWSADMFTVGQKITVNGFNFNLFKVKGFSSFEIL